MNNFEHTEYFPENRRNEILEFIRRNKTASVKELSRALFINEATIRRDLKLLEMTGLIRRTYGGAALSEGLDTELPLFVRDTENRDKKEIIGEKAAASVNDGDSLFVDSSSTCLRLIPHLKNKTNLKIITNGLKTTALLTKLTNCKIYCTGGLLSENNQSFVGSEAINFLKNFYADKVFFSCRGIDADHGITNDNDDEAHLRRHMIEHSRKSFLLADSTKFTQTSFYLISPLSAIDQIISNIPIPASFLAQLKSQEQPPHIKNSHPS